jgi:hypothetical protein
MEGTQLEGKTEEYRVVSVQLLWELVSLFCIVLSAGEKQNSLFKHVNSKKYILKIVPQIRCTENYKYKVCCLRDVCHIIHSFNLSSGTKIFINTNFMLALFLALFLGQLK